MTNQSQSQVNGRKKKNLSPQPRFSVLQQSQKGLVAEQLDKVEALIVSHSFKEAHQNLLEFFKNHPISTPSEEVYRYRYLLGHCLWKLGHASEALVELEEALRVFRTVHNTLVLPEEKGLPDFALEQLRQLREIELGILDTVNGHGRGQNGKEKKEVLARRIFEISSALNSIRPLANIHRLLGAVYVNLGKLERATEHLTSAATGFKLSKDPASAARSLNRLANLHIVLGELKRALEYAEEARENALKSGDQYYPVIQDGVTAVCYHLLGNWKLSIHCLKEFLIETKKANNFFNYSSGLVNLGHAEFVGGRFKEARKHYLEAVRVCLKENLIGNLKVAYEFLSELSIAEGRFPEAEDYLKKALEIGERVSPYGTIMTQCWRLMGDLYNAKGQPSEALKAYETCESYLIKLPEELERGACFVGWGVAYTKLEQWNVSRDSFEKAFDVFAKCENDWETAKAVVTSVETGAYSAKQVKRQLIISQETFQKLDHPAWVKRVDVLLAQPDVGPLSPNSLRAEKMGVERGRVLEALEKTGGNRTKAAELLGIPRTTLTSILKRIGSSE